MSMNRNTLSVALGLFIVGYGTNVSTPFLVLYRDRLGLNTNATQLIFVVYVVGILSTLMVAGQLSDRYGRKRLLVASLALSAVGSLLIVFGRDAFGLLIAGRIVLGIVSGLGLGVGAAWLQDLLGPGQQAKAALIATLVTYGGFGAAPPLSVLYEWLGPSPLVVPFLFHIAITLAVIPAVLKIDETVDVAAAAQNGHWRPAVRFGVPAAARRQFLWYISPLAILIFAFPSMAFALFPVLLSDTVDASPVVLTGFSGAATAWGGLLSRPLIRRIPTRTAMGWGAAIGTVGYALGTLAFVTGAWPLVWPAAVVLGAASGVISVAGLTLVGELTDPESRGALSSTFYLLAYTGMTMPLIVSSLSGAFSTTQVLVTVTCFAAALAASAPLRQRLGSA
ncbi:MAG: MFS family permease [Acidimicrobiales bacterium]|jgi:MFS family permease